MSIVLRTKMKAQQLIPPKSAKTADIQITSCAHDSKEMSLIYLISGLKLDFRCAAIHFRRKNEVVPDA